MLAIDGTEDTCSLFDLATGSIDKLDLVADRVESSDGSAAAVEPLLLVRIMNAIEVRPANFGHIGDVLILLGHTMCICFEFLTTSRPCSNFTVAQ